MNYNQKNCYKMTDLLEINQKSELMMENVLEQANIASHQQNWPLLNHYLRQTIEQEKGRTSQATLDRKKILHWALEVLEWGDFQDRWEVVKIFPSLGTIAIAPLTNILQDEEAEEELRWFVVRILAEFNTQEVIHVLVEILKTSESEELTAMAAEALANLGQNAIAALTELLTAEETRLLAVRSLSAIRRSETITPLLTVVKDPQIYVRVAAIEALSSFHDSRIPPVLLDALKDIAAPVRKEAVIGLGLRPELREDLDLGNQIIPLLWDFNLEVCAAAAQSLARLGTNAAADALFKVLRSPNTPLPLQLQCVRSLGWMETPQTLEYLQQALNLESLPVYQEVVTILGRLEKESLTPAASQILIAALRSQHPALEDNKIRQAFAVSLGQLATPESIDSLIHLLVDRDLGVRLHAIAALKKFPTAIGQLKELIANESSPSQLRQGVALALQEF